MATFEPPSAEKLFFSDKTFACLIDCTPKRIHCDSKLYWWIPDPRLSLDSVQNYASFSQSLRCQPANMIIATNFPARRRTKMIITTNFQHDNVPSPRVDNLCKPHRTLLHRPVSSGWFAKSCSTLITPHFRVGSCG